MRRKALTFRGTLKPSKAQSSPIFMDVKRIDIFHNQKTSLESLSNLIKYHQVNFFSISLEKNESDNIIETLLSLKNSLINSLNNQTQQRNDLLKKVKKNYYFIFQNENYFIDKKDINNINFEISQLKNLNFTIENELLKIDFLIKYTKDKIHEYKKIDFIREEKRDIYLNSKNEIYQVEKQLNMKLLNLKKQLEEMIIQEEQDLSHIEILNEKFNKYKEIYINGKYGNKYINVSEIIEEDKNEDITKSFNNFTNSFITNNTKKEDLTSFNSNDKDICKKNKGNLMILDHFIMKRNFDEKKNDSNIKNVNLNINLNINVKHNEKKF